MKRILIQKLALSFLNYVGCYSSRAVDKEILISKNIDEAVGELTILTNDDNKIIIDEITYQIVDDTLYAEVINKTNTEVYGNPIDVKIALADIQQVEIDEFNEVGTIVYIIASITGLVVLVYTVVAVSSFKWPKSCKAHGFNFQPD